jgi:hypothetical protein
VVDPGLAGVQLWGWGPFDFAAGVDGGGPAVLVDHAVVGSAGQAEFVDVGVAAVDPIGHHVMDLAAVGPDGAARFGAATIAGLIAPVAWAAAVAASTGSRGSPVNVRRGPNSAASVSRPPASVLEIRHRVLSTSRQNLAPVSFGVVSACKRANTR